MASAMFSARDVGEGTEDECRKHRMNHKMPPPTWHARYFL